MSQRNAAIGFLLAPLAPSFVFAFGAFLLGVTSELLLPLPLSTYIFGMFIWFLYAVVVAYPVTLIVGIPGYLIYKKFCLTSLKSYLVGGFTLGALAPLTLMPIFGIHETLNFSYWFFLISSFFGAVTCVTFWFIVTKKTGQVFHRT